MTWSITDTELSAFTIQRSKIINMVPKTPRTINKLVQLNLLLWHCDNLLIIPWFYDYTHNILYLDIDGLAQERRNSIANALELHLFCTNPST